MYFLLTIVLLYVCCIGDYILTTSNRELIRAFVDNSTHSVAALVSWLIVLLKCHKKSSIVISPIFELLCCAFLASAIDVDHFLYAKSFHLKHATNLGKKRPILHCTTLPLMILFLCLGFGWTFDSPKTWRFGWLVWVAVFSHHVRDSSRRGLWLWPFGSSPPVPYYLYLSITLALPYLVMIPLKDWKYREAVLPMSDYITV